MRRDAEDNRNRLIQAGRQLVQEKGGDVPIEAFCEAASVNRATFYRNFSDRSALYAALCDYELELMSEVIKSTKDPLTFLSALSEMMAVFDRFVSSLSNLPEISDAPMNDEKVRAVIAGPLERAKLEGWIRPNIEADDILVISRMIGCSWRLDHQPSREIAVRRRLKLVMDGLRPPPISRSSR